MPHEYSRSARLDRGHGAAVTQFHRSLCLCLIEAGMHPWILPKPTGRMPSSNRTSFSTYRIADHWNSKIAMRAADEASRSRKRNGMSARGDGVYHVTLTCAVQGFPLPDCLRILSRVCCRTATLLPWSGAGAGAGLPLRLRLLLLDLPTTASSTTTPARSPPALHRHQTTSGSAPSG